MSRAIDLALTRVEAHQVRDVLVVVCNSPHIWREADGWHQDALVAVRDRLAVALEDATP